MTLGKNTCNSTHAHMDRENKDTNTNAYTWRRKQTHKHEQKHICKGIHTKKLVVTHTRTHLHTCKSIRAHTPTKSTKERTYIRTSTQNTCRGTGATGAAGGGNTAHMSHIVYVRVRVYGSRMCMCIWFTYVYVYVYAYRIPYIVYHVYAREERNRVFVVMMESVRREGRGF